MPDQLNYQFFVERLLEKDELVKSLDHLQEEEGHADNVGTPYPLATLRLRNNAKVLIVTRILAIDALINKFCDAFEIDIPLSNET